MQNITPNLTKDCFRQKFRFRQLGQSMVEYTVVTVFGVLVLTTGPGRGVIDDLTNAIRNNYEGYTYAVSLSDYPDKDNPLELVTLYNSQGMPIEQVAYLVDVPTDLINDILNYNISGFPSVQEGLDFLDDVGLSFTDFCSPADGCPLSLF
jgi:hypothetical protein